LKRGDMVTTELTPCVDGYYAQICRTLVVGEPSAEQKAAHALWRESMEAGIAVVRDGVTAADIARAENDVFRQHGLGKYTTSEYTRVRGHGLGLFVDTKPHLLEDVTTRIDAGMTLVVHPNTYHPVVGYLVLGDSVIVTQDGCELLTGTPRELFSVAA
jgi:Xaa-Pro dipeptidase